MRRSGDVLSEEDHSSRGGVKVVESKGNCSFLKLLSSQFQKETAFRGGGAAEALSRWSQNSKISGSGSARRASQRTSPWVRGVAGGL